MTTVENVDIGRSEWFPFDEFDFRVYAEGREGGGFTTRVVRTWVFPREVVEESYRSDLRFATEAEAIGHGKAIAQRVCESPAGGMLSPLARLTT